MIDGNKYYKLTITDYGIEIKCTGDYNAFSMKGTINRKMGNSNWVHRGK